MKRQFQNMKLGTAFMAIIMVILMSAGAFAGASENFANSDNNIEAILPTMETATATEEADSNTNTPVDEPVIDDDFINPIVPETGPIEEHIEVEEKPKEVIDMDLDTSVNIPDSSMDPDLPPATEDNTFSDGLEDISEHIDIDDGSLAGDASTSTRAPLASLTMVIGTDNNAKDGQGMGYTRRSSTRYYSYDGYYMYNYVSGTSYESRGWANFDISDMKQYNGVSVTSGEIWWRHDYRRNVGTLDFYTMKSNPYEISGSSSTAKGWYDEVGGTGSIKLGTNTFTGTYDSSNKDMKATISSSGISWLNTQLSGSDHDIAIGGDISKLNSGTYGYVYCYDVRLKLTFSYTSMPDDAVGEVAVGDTLSGYTYRTYTNYDTGLVRPYYSYYRAYATWDVSQYKDLIPAKGPGGEKVEITGISLRINNNYGYLNTLAIYHMKNDPKSASTSTIYSDAADGTKYLSFSSGGSTSTADEFDWDLGADALDDFNDTLDSSPSFFALGFSRSSYYQYMYSPKLVIHWKINYPPMHTLRMGADNPEKAGQSMGYTRQSGSYYYCYSYYYSYIYKSGSTDYHGWMTFDLDDLKKWDGAEVKSAKLIFQNYYSYYIKDLEFTALKTTPYHNPGTTVAKAVYTESGSGGTVIGSHSISSTTDTSYHKVEVPLNSAAVTAINNKVNSTSTYKTFGVGMRATSLHRTYGYMRWMDARLEVKFTYDSELKSSTSGDGLSFGDDYSGHMYKRTQPIDRPYGYVYVRKSSYYEYRGYAQWDISDIQGAFDQANISKIKFTKVSLAMNHYRNTLSKIEVHQMTNNISLAADSTIYTDCGDGTKYYSGSTGSSYADNHWDLGTGAVSDFQAAFEDNSPDFFGVGIITTASSGYLYDFAPRLVLEFKVPEKGVNIALVDETPKGYEGSPVMFNANETRNVSGGDGSMYYLWDFDGDSVFDYNSTTPYAQKTWDDDYVGKVFLKVVDTDAMKSAMINFTVVVHNVDPICNTTNGKISPQPAYEASTVTFSGYTVDDPGNDTWWYFWDFENDGIYDKGGKCSGKTVPTETWFYEDDFLGDASLLIVDEDGGTTNITESHELTIVPNTYWTGYAYYYGSKYSSYTIYYRYSYSYDYQRGWAKWDLSKIPEDAIVKKVVFKANVMYNRSVNRFGVRLLKSDPVSASGSTVFSEAGSGTRVFGMTGTTGDKSKDLTNWIQNAGKTTFENALSDGWIAFGFDHESPTSGYTYGYMRGYGYDMPKLEVDYITQTPGCFIPVRVMNRPPVLSCTNLTLSKSSLNEGDMLQVSNISFCDPGNDTYEVKFVVGGEFESDWILLGDSRPLGKGIVLNEFNTGSSDWVEIYNYGPDQDMSGWEWYWHDNRNYQGTYTIPSGFTLKSQKFVVIHETSGSNSATDLYMGSNMMWTPSSSNGIAGELRNEKGDGVDFFRTSGDPTTPTTGTVWYSPDITYPVSNDVGRRTTDTDTNSGKDWTVGGTSSEGTLNPGQTGKGQTQGSSEKGWGVYGPGCHNVNQTFNVTIPDDYPSTGTSWDDVTVTVYVRDDDDHKLIPGTGIGGRKDPATIHSTAYYYYTGYNGRKAVIDEDYNIYAIYVDSSASYQVFVARSSDNGETWEKFKVTSPSYFGTYSQYNPSLTIDSDGVLHATWRSYYSGLSGYHIRYANSNDGGATWGNFKNVTSTSYGRNYMPVIAVDGSDNVHIAWYGYGEGGSYPYKIWHISRSSTGTWSSISQVSESVYSYNPDIIADSNDNVHIVWRGYLSSSSYYYNIRHRQLWSSNSTWSVINNITSDTTSGVYNYDPGLAVDSNDDIHVVWYGRDPVYNVYYNIQYCKFDSSTGKWGARELITEVETGYPYFYQPSIIVNSAGEMDVVWHGRQSPSWSYPYVIHHAEKTSTGWDINYDILTGGGNQYYPTLLGASPNSLAEKGFAFVYFDNTYPYKLWMSADFEFGDPEFTDGMDWCNKTVRVYNVEPTIDVSRVYTVPEVVKEQEEFLLHAEFEDPAAGVHTEPFEFNLTWGSGQYTGWQEVTKFKEGQPAGLTQLTIQPDATDGKDTYTYAYSSYQNYNYGTNNYVYMGKTSTSSSYIRRAFLDWDLSWIPAGYNVTNATMRLNFLYKYLSGPSSKAHWYTVNESWIEGTKSGSTGTGDELTWNNMPGYDTTEEVSNLTWGYGSGMTEWAMNLSIVKDWIANPENNHGMVSVLDVETTSNRGYGYFYSSDYPSASLRPQLVLEFDRPLPAILPRGIIEVTHMIPDDHPETGTPWDYLDLNIEVRDDDLGSDSAKTNVTVHNVPPEVLPGQVTPNVLGSEPVPEGTLVSLEGFRFNDVAYKVPTEFNYGFNYSIDWGDGTPQTPWKNDFTYTSNAGEFYSIKEGTSSSAPAYNNGRKMVMDSKGNMYAIYRDYPSPYQIYISVSDDVGESWTEYKVSSDTDSSGRYQYYPSLAIDSNDVLHAVWQAYVPVPTGYSERYSIRYANSVDGGATWGNFSVLALGAYYYNYPIYYYNYEEMPAIAIDSNDVVHVTWQHYRYYRSYSPSTWFREYSIRYVNNTGGWGTPVDVFSNNGTSYYPNRQPSIDVDSSDNVHIAWYGSASGSTYNIKYRQLWANNGTWEPMTMLTTGSSNPQYYPCIVVDDDDNVHVTWHGYPWPYQIRYISRDSSTGAWGAVEGITSNSNYNYYPSIGYDQRGYLYIVWYKYSPYEIMMVYNDGTGWSDEVELTTPDKFTSGVYYANIMYGGEHSVAPKGAALLFSGYDSTTSSYNMFWTSTPDFYLGVGIGPQRGIPAMEHLYRDDNPTATPEDEYTIKLMVRDDDTGTDTWELTFEIRNVWPVINKTGLSKILIGYESNFSTPEVHFMDPGSGPNETWIYWLDVDNSETLTSIDIVGTVTDTEFKDNVTYGIIPPILTPINDDMYDEIGLYIYDDDTPSDLMFINISYKINVGTGNITTIDSSSHSSSTAYNNARNIVFDSSGNLYSIYTDGPTPYQIYCGVSSDLGETWDNYLVSNDTLSSNIDQYYPSIAIDSNDVLHVVWQAHVPVPSSYSSRSSIRYANSADGGKTWENFTVLALGLYKYKYPINYFNNEEHPAICVDSDDVVHVSWDHYQFFRSYSPSFTFREYGIRYVNNRGGVWGKIENVTLHNSTKILYQNYPSIAVDKNNDIHITWQGYQLLTSNTYNILYRKLDSSTSSWAPIINITSETGGYLYSSFNPCIVTDLNNNVHIVWHQIQTKWWKYAINVRQIMYNSTSSSWMEVINITNTSTDYYYSATVGVDHSGTIYVSWVGGSSVEGSKHKIYFSKRLISQSEFETPVIITNTTEYGSQNHPSILGQGSNCYPVTGSALVWVGEYNSKYHTLFYCTDDFWLGDVYEPDGHKVKFKCYVDNVEPTVIFDSLSLIGVIFEPMEIKFTVTDVGSDDLFYDYAISDGSMPVSKGPFFNNEASPDPLPSALTGTAPFIIQETISKTYYIAGTFFMNVTVWDDDMAYTGQKVHFIIKIRVLGPRDLKEEAIKMLEPLAPGRLGVVGYRNITLKMYGSQTVTVFAYNHISQGPFGWETKLFYTFCDVKPNSEIFLDGSLLDSGMFGDKIILKAYVGPHLYSEIDIPTIYSCLGKLRVGQRFKDEKITWCITDLGEVTGVTYHHYSKYALLVEDAIDNILFSLNKDPRRGYGWWHSQWIFFCDYWFQRELWISNTTLDPQFGSVVFCRELFAVQYLMETINNCLKCDGVHNMTFRWDGDRKVDIEIYSYGLWWRWWNKWEHTHTFLEVNPGDEFFIGSRGLPLCGKLAQRTLINVYDYNTGELLDAQYIRTSGLWPLEVEPGNRYGNLEIVDATLKLGCGNFWREWFGDHVVWDYGNFQTSRSKCSPNCYDAEIAQQEEARICSNLTIIKTAISFLVKADELLAKISYFDAQNMTPQNESNAEEYEFHLKMSKRHYLRAQRDAAKGKPHEAIRFFRLAWQNSVLAIKWVILKHEDTNETSDPAEDELYPDFDNGCGSYLYKKDGSKLWWLWWYLKYQHQLRVLFGTFPDWKEYTDWNESWSDYISEYLKKPKIEDQYCIKKSSWYIAYEDYYSDYDFNDWGMKVYMKKHVDKVTTDLKKLELDFIADTNLAGYAHFIHLRLAISNKVHYTWKVTYYNQHGKVKSAISSRGYDTGEFDQVIFNTCTMPDKYKMDPYKTTVEIEFQREIKMYEIDWSQFDPYMYVKNTKMVIHTDTFKQPTEKEAKGSSPNLENKDVPMILFIGDINWVPPKDGENIWKKYDKFDDWVAYGRIPEEQWWK